MSLCQVGDMDVVPNASAIWCVIVCTKDGNCFPLAVWNLQNQRNQVAFRIVCFTDCASLICTASVEIPERNIPQTMCLCSPIEHLFHCQLGFAIWVGRTGAVGFQNRNIFRFAVSSSGRGENNFLDIVSHHCFQQYLCATEVVVIILQRQVDAFANQRASSEVNHSINLFLGEQVIEECTVTDVALIEGCTFRNGSPETGLQVVSNNNFFASTNQFECGMRADVTSTAEY